MLNEIGVKELSTAAVAVVSAVIWFEGRFRGIAKKNSDQDLDIVALNTQIKSMDKELADRRADCITLYERMEKANRALDVMEALASREQNERAGDR